MLTVADDLVYARTRFLLTPRELEVLRSMMRGQQARETATALGIAENTVRAHCKALLEKTGARNRPHMIALVLGYERAHGKS